MKFEKKQMTLENGIDKEWLITNGIGGYASSTILGANTRKYHGLLVAPLTPPARRFLVLSKVDESIELEGKKYPLYTNIGRSYISEGYQYLTSFEKDYIPIFTYKIGEMEIKKLICMEYGKNTVGILYKIRNGKQAAKLTVAPLINFRDFHTMSTNKEFDIRQEIKKNKVKIVVDRNAEYPIYCYMNAGVYIPHQKDIFRDMYYIEEEKRGFYPEENHSVIGRYEIEIASEEEKEISFVCSLEENIEPIEVKDLINHEITRIRQLMNESGLIDIKNTNPTKEEKEYQELVKEYIVASDNFVVYRPNFRTHTLIAGYPWFLDWGRDALISFEGILLKTKRYEIAKEVLLTFTRDIKFGLVPNGYSGYDNRPLYNSVDASLLLFEAIQKYMEYTKDKEFVKTTLYLKLLEIIHSYRNGVDLDHNNIYLDNDYLLVAGTPETQNTWMDVKYDGVPVTPRNGKAVEINSLWYNALKIMASLVQEVEGKEKAKEYEALARKAKKAFEEKFYNKRRKCLYDVLGDKKIRPNQLFSISLTYPILDPNSEIANQMMETVTKKLLNQYGLKTLAKGEEHYSEIYEGDVCKRDKTYHQGITWTWLLGPYYNALKNRIKFAKKKTEKKELEEQLEQLKSNIKKTFVKEMNENGMIGSLSELHDSKMPYTPKGAPAQCWSVAETLRIIL